jgi:hypothetical protein
MKFLKESMADGSCLKSGGPRKLPFETSQEYREWQISKVPVRVLTGNGKQLRTSLSFVLLTLWAKSCPMQIPSEGQETA